MSLMLKICYPSGGGDSSQVVTASMLIQDSPILPNPSEYREDPASFSVLVVLDTAERPTE